MQPISFKSDRLLAACLLKIGDSGQAIDAPRSRRYVVIIVRGRDVIDIAYIFGVGLDAKHLGQPDKQCRVPPREARQNHGVVECGIHVAAMHDTKTQPEQWREIRSAPGESNRL